MLKGKQLKRFTEPGFDHWVFSEGAQNYSPEQPRDHGKFASSTGHPDDDPARGRPSLAHERHKTEDGSAPLPKALPWQDPPAKLGRKGKGMKQRPKGEESQTKVGDLGELLATQLGFRSILPEGARSHAAGEVTEKGSTIDVEYDHSGRAYEIKLCNRDATEYRLKAKVNEKDNKLRYAEMHDLTLHTMVAVRDAEEGIVHFYAHREPGMSGAEVSPKKFDYVGSVRYFSKLPQPSTESSKGRGTKIKRGGK